MFNTSAKIIATSISISKKYVKNIVLKKYTKDNETGILVSKNYYGNIMVSKFIFIKYIKKFNKYINIWEVFLMSMVRLELATPGLQTQCSSHWAIELKSYCWEEVEFIQFILNSFPAIAFELFSSMARTLGL